ncbi:DUF370 domain-containing protein [Fervidobacterium pennivorans subsp. shakshaketiis]|jgi:hypothetical protein|uniref:DUF370 domain-containing protein n=1 Tax=Fervidobacterium pennivorans (strain DSM 9078 / Ven5) TaxID=771875 RepID=H9UCU9_FERPD|nr:DUF370 domain-containing protein [Fervidobacterium pennivorans]AFG35342.1 hypothetical protein Ferpe_1262 [Fervidobacterium pennivorans DSM 9078]QIV78302.1 DUF370 domain-containing protein [Fervidobacterium pennivorans subsp. keratinolyticus]
MSEAVARINENVYIVRDRVIAVIPITSTVSRRIRASSQLGGKMVNLSYGKECKSIVFMDSGHSLLLAEPALEVRKKIWG